jgi:tetratricopeptide (TPR) repeat protein
MIGRAALLMICLVAATAIAQNAPQQPDRPAQPQSPSSADQNSSSSRSTKTDISPPVGDAGEHPNSSVGDLAPATAETHPWNPHRADKDVEVGDYHLKRKNYRAAEDRYREALYYQDNNAQAMFGLAETLEKENKRDEAVTYYTKYLKTLPNGPRAADAKKALQRLGAPLPQVSQNDLPPPPEPTQLYEKKSIKQRAKDAATPDICIFGLCKQTKPSEHPDPAPQPK